jgi:hypothetical protein
MIGSLVCCARTASDLAAAVPPTSVMNSRRLMILVCEQANLFFQGVARRYEKGS